jgi:hypothetical protein
MRTFWQISPALKCTRKLTEDDIPDRQSLKSAITHIFDEIRQETLVAVFETWINRLAWVIEHRANTSISK